MTTIPGIIADYITHTLPTMDGWCSPEKAEALARHVLTDHPSTCIEVGVYAGRSLFAIGLALKHLNHGWVHGIDPWSAAASTAGWENDPANRDWWAGKTSRLDHDAIYQQCRDHLATLGLTQHVQLLRATSDDVATLLASSNPHYDLVHIDGNHSEAQALRDVENYVTHVRPGGLVAFDDTDWQTTKLAQRRLADLCDPLPSVGTCGFYRRR